MNSSLNGCSLVLLQFIQDTETIFHFQSDACRNLDRFHLVLHVAYIFSFLYVKERETGHQRPVVIIQSSEKFPWITWFHGIDALI